MNWRASGYVSCRGVGIGNAAHPGNQSYYFGKMDFWSSNAFDGSRYDRDAVQQQRQACALAVLIGKPGVHLLSRPSYQTHEHSHARTTDTQWCVNITPPLRTQHADAQAHAHVHSGSHAAAAIMAHERQRHPDSQTVRVWCASKICLDAHRTGLPRPELFGLESGGSGCGSRRQRGGVGGNARAVSAMFCTVAHATCQQSPALHATCADWRHSAHGLTYALLSSHTHTLYVLAPSHSVLVAGTNRA